MIQLAERLVKNRIRDDSPDEDIIKPVVIEITVRMYYHPEENPFDESILKMIDDISEDYDEKGLYVPDYVYDVTYD